jgi:hypothetical protein
MLRIMKDLGKTVQSLRLIADNSYPLAMAHDETTNAMGGRSIRETVTPHLAALIADGTVRPGRGPRHLPKPTQLRGVGRDAVSYVIETRR